MRCQTGYVNVGVRDLNRSIAFCRDVLGFGLVFSEPAFHYARFDVGGFRFAIAASEVDHFTGGAPGNRHTGIGLTVADVDAAAAELTAKGVQFPMAPASSLGAAIWASSPIPTAISSISERVRHRA